MPSNNPFREMYDLIDAHAETLRRQVRELEPTCGGNCGQPGGCQHQSDCALHSRPAEPNGPCTCASGQRAGEITVGPFVHPGDGQALRAVTLPRPDPQSVAITTLRHALETVMRHAPGYDWNADPERLTLLVGNAYEKAEAVLGQRAGEEA